MSTLNKYTFPDRTISKSLSKLVLPLCLLGGCDSLWRPFTVDDPSSCATTNGNNPCSDQQLCNRSTGRCEPKVTQPPLDPLSFSSITPGSLPLAGGPITIYGRGFSSDTTVAINNGAIGSIVPSADQTKLSGVAPRATQACVPLDVKLQRGNEAPLSIPGAFRYRFEPFSVQSLVSVGAVSGLQVNQLLLAPIDGDSRMDLVVGHSNGFRVLFAPDGVGAMLSTAGLRTGFLDKIRVGKLSNSGNSDVIAIQGKSLYVEYCTGFCTQKASYDSMSPIRDAFVADVLPDPGNELVAVISDVGIKGYVSVLKNSAGMLAPDRTVYTASEDILDASAGDMNLDGTSDALFLITASKLSMLPMGPPGTPQWTPKTYSTLLGRLSAPVLGNLDGDGVADLVTYNPSKGTLIVAYGKNDFANFVAYGSSQFPPGTAAESVEIQLADANCDGALDIVVSLRNTQNGPFFFLNDGQGNFGNTLFRPDSGGFAPSAGGPFAMFDADGDKLPDIIMRSPTGGGLMFGRGKLP